MKGRVFMKNIRNKKGFTIIEVVLVLAIAGLIFMMVFVALPALQRSQRDTSRKNDVSIVSSAVTSFSSNNRGAFPTKAQLRSYVTDVSSNTTSVVVSGTTGQNTYTSTNTPEGTIRVTAASTCGASTPDSQELKAGSARQYTVVTKLESGSGTYFCQGN